MTENHENENQETETKVVKDWRDTEPNAEVAGTEPAAQPGFENSEPPMPPPPELSPEDLEKEAQEAAITQARIQKTIRYGRVRAYLSKKLDRKGDTIISPLTKKRIDIDDKVGYITAIMSWSMSLLSNPETARQYGNEVVQILDGASYTTELVRMYGERTELDALIDCVMLGFIQDVFNSPTSPLDPIYFKSFYTRKNIDLIKDMKKERMRGLLIDLVHKDTNLEQMIDLFASYRDNIIAGKQILDEMEK